MTKTKTKTLARDAYPSYRFGLRYINPKQESNMKYEEAIKELETIVSQIEKNELDIDQLTERLKVAQELIKQCRDKLYKTDEEIKAMLEE